MTGTKTPSSELTQRVLVGAILIVVAVAEVWLGGTALWVLATVGGLIMISEFAGLLDVSDQKSANVDVCIMHSSGCAFADRARPKLFRIRPDRGNGNRNRDDFAQPRFGGGQIYVGLPILALLWLRDQPGNGLVLTFWALSLVWATDIGAFFSGRSIGGPKIAPAISPSKTWAGLIGGMTCATILAACFHFWLGLALPLVWITPLLAVAAQGGDFLESWMKRRAGVKDSGTLLPGHGEVLDRLDGVVTAVPLAALFVALGLAS